jgi:hypothetical protein
LEDADDVLGGELRGGLSEARSHFDVCGFVGELRRACGCDARGRERERKCASMATVIALVAGLSSLGM